MELIYRIIDLCTFFTLIFLYSWAFVTVINLVRIVFYKLKKEEVAEDIEILNPLRMYSVITAGVQYKTRVVIRIMSILGIIGLILEGVSYTNLGSDTIGSYIERNEYSAYYYVNMFPEDSINKNYRVKAMINSTRVEASDDKGTYKERHYYIEEAYFDNGDVITFYDSWGNTLKLNKKVSVEDDFGDYWKIELTNIKAN